MTGCTLLKTDDGLTLLGVSAGRVRSDGHLDKLSLGLTVSAEKVTDGLV